MVNPGYTAETLAALCAQEEELVFDHFDASDAKAIGNLLLEAMAQEVKPVAMQAVLNGFTVFSYFPPETGAINEFWMGKKYNTVCKTLTSSLRAVVELTLSGRRPAPWELDEDHYALCGGGFPIQVRGKGVVGVYCISGLPHLDDHRLLTGVLARYLGIPPRPLPLSLEAAGSLSIQ